MTPIGRRELLLAIGTSSAAAAAAASALPVAALTASHAAAAPVTPIDVYAKIRCSLADELVPFWYRGQAMIALQDDIPRPILGVEGFSYTRFSRTADGSWRTKLIEAGYFTDLTTGQIIEEAVNPLNGRRIVPQHFLSPAQVFDVRPDGSVLSQHKLEPPSQFSGRIWPPLRQGTEIWVDEDLLARLSTDALPPTMREPGPARMLSLGSMTTYRSHAADVANPQLASAPCTFHLQELSSLPRWFQMDEEVGKQLWRLSGRKLGSVAEIPPPLRARIERDHPSFIREPGI